MPTYSDMREQLRTGDIVLFSGKSAVSNIIKLFSGGKWSHVGMVLIVEEFDRMVLLWESTTLSNIPDIESRAPTKGVQSGARKELSRKPYERSQIELLKAAYEGIGGASSGEDLSSLFCSELVAEAQRIAAQKIGQSVSRLDLSYRQDGPAHLDRRSPAHPRGLHRQPVGGAHPAPQALRRHELRRGRGAHGDCLPGLAVGLRPA